ncbi:MAG TPA: acyl carrier protein [Streptomyces sp.]|uniref:acyl carrier protein n=1 Tax=Streptomyces sp. TaxID=1931 RepID=UPI002D314520|nr:acyl carrier protein [Streptomyces sp.]HZG04694.1 acyl carrier protein [Streptomyces sp.]
MTTGATAAPDAAGTVRAELLDCIQSNLAVLADRFHGPGRHLLLGATLRFRPRPGPAGLPTVEPPLEEQLADAARLGLAERARWHRVPGAELRTLAERHGPLYAVADAFHMPWLPYHGQRHMEHSFLVEPAPAAAGITDAYYNPTPWGLAAPGRWEQDWHALPTASVVVLLEPAADGTGAPGTVTPGTDLAPAAERERYVAAFADHPDRVAALEQLTAETWFLARSRKLHAACRDALGRPAGPGTEDHLRRWDRLAEQTFVALRRVQRGRPEPERLLPELAAALAADRAVFDGAADGLRTAVVAVVAEVLGTGVEAVLAAPELPALRGFDSFRVVEIVEGLEERLGIEFDPEELLPENLHHLDELCRLVARSARP